MPQLTLYLSAGACSMAAHVGLLEAGAEFTPRHISLAKSEHLRADYRKINPHAQVPALKIGDRVLTENVAILPWIAKTWPEADLLPLADPDEESRTLSYLGWLSSSVHTAFGPLFHPERYVDGSEAKRELARHARQHVQDHFAEIDAHLKDKEYSLGRFSLADIYLFAFYGWGANYLKLDMAQYPHFTALYQRLLQRPSVQRMQEAEQELAKAA